MKQILYKLFEHQYLGRDEARTILQNIAQGKYNDVQVASLITVFLMRNISVEELCGFRDALLEMRIPVDLSEFAPIDIVGTGGDGKNTFNISTASCFTVAGAGFPVVKHGNYGATSVSGASNVIDRTKEYNQVCLKSAGIVTHFERDGNLDKIYYINENLHTLLVGSTGSGKSRSVIIPTITMLGLAGENMCISDVKGELYLYTAENLKKIGYDVIAIDYINFLKSNKYNYLDIIINAVEQDNIPLAESLINDLVNILVEKNEKTEPIWKNGEMSVIKTAIMAVVLENKGRREYQTLPNAYYFVAEMFKERNGKMPIDEYMAKKEANDPIKKFFAIARYSTTENKSKFCCCCTIYTSNVCR